MQGVNLISISFVLQTIGFVLMIFAWARALTELHRGERLFKTRLLMFVITTTALFAYIVPMLIAGCYFIPGCFQPYYRDYLRLFSGLVMLLYPLFKVLLYYTKDNDI